MTQQAAEKQDDVVISWLVWSWCVCVRTFEVAKQMVNYIWQNREKCSSFGEEEC